jgi:hypothetical protein
LENEHCCGIKLRRIKKSDTEILIPPNERYKMEILMALLNKSLCPVVIELRQENTHGVVFKKKYTYEEGSEIISINDVLIMESSGKQKNILTIRLLSHDELKVNKARVQISEI